MNEAGRSKILAIVSGSIQNESHRLNLLLPGETHPARGLMGLGECVTLATRPSLL